MVLVLFCKVFLLVANCNIINMRWRRGWCMLCNRPSLNFRYRKKSSLSHNFGAPTPGEPKLAAIVGPESLCRLWEWHLGHLRQLWGQQECWFMWVFGSVMTPTWRCVEARISEIHVYRPSSVLSLM